MNRRSIVIATALVATATFAVGAFLVQRHRAEQAAQAVPVADTSLVRAHSPVIGPANARVTVVEFFDPACEACRAFYPFVKQILAHYPDDVRLVLRYAAFHPGSDEAVGILEAARAQGKFEPVLEALLAQQPQWASHDAPSLAKAWDVAAAAGLDLDRARHDAASPATQRLLQQDMADVRANQVRQTPSFFVNGKPLTNFGPKPLFELVQSEVGSK